MTHSKTYLRLPDCFLSFSFDSLTQKEASCHIPGRVRQPALGRGRHSRHRKQPKQRPPGQNVSIHKEEQGGNGGDRSRVAENEVKKAVRDPIRGRALIFIQSVIESHGRVAMGEVA